MTQQTRTPRSRLAPDQPASPIVASGPAKTTAAPDVTPVSDGAIAVDSAATEPTVRAVLVDIRLPFFSVVRLIIYVIMATVPAGIFIALFVVGLIGLLSR